MPRPKQAISRRLSMISRRLSMASLMLSAGWLHTGCGGGGSAAGDPGLPAPQVNPLCTNNSVVGGDGALVSRTVSHPCARYGLASTRNTADGGAVTMDYLLASPSRGQPKALLVLIGGSNFDMGISGDAASGLATGSGGNFLVRSAKIFAEAGYQVVALDRPSDMPSGPTDNEIGNVDRYRISVRHAVDILGIVQQLNSSGLDVFVVGTSRGSLSAVAQSEIASGIVISSPVTTERPDAPLHLYLNDPRQPGLQPGSVKRPALVMYNALDECNITPPAGAQALYRNMLAAGIKATLVDATGGATVTRANALAAPDACGSISYHGYLGIENLAVARSTAWLDTQVAALAGNRKPEARPVAASTAAGTALTLDLAAQVSDADGDKPRISLPFAETERGGSLSLNGSTLRYVPPAGAGPFTDRFVYAATDAKGSVAAAVVTVSVGR